MKTLHTYLSRQILASLLMTVAVIGAIVYKALNIWLVSQTDWSKLVLGAFIVLKSIIAEDESGAQSMSEWAIEETRMVVERITGVDGTEGWTVSWKGSTTFHTRDRIEIE